MGNRSRAYPKPMESRTPEEITKEKERVRKLKLAKTDASFAHTGHPRLEDVDACNALLDALEKRGHAYAEDDPK